MAEIHINVPYREIQRQLVEQSDRYVKRIYQTRKDECLMAAGDILEENGYLPEGTTYEPWNDQLWFSIDKGTNADLAHYFHEGMIYGPNFFIKKINQWRSPKGKSKYPTGKMLNQYVGSPLGVRHWTEAVANGGPLHHQLEERIAEILEK